jgi:hypothetical protein
MSTIKECKLIKEIKDKSFVYTVQNDMTMIVVPLLDVMNIILEMSIDYPKPSDSMNLEDLTKLYSIELQIRYNKMVMDTMNWIKRWMVGIE